MASSDKNTARSNAGRSSAEPAQQVSEAAGGPESLKSLISRNLSRAAATAPVHSAANLETKLGIVTITILVFAFGFLVYRKFDLHQQQLMQASIAAPDTQVVPDTLATQASADQPILAVTDSNVADELFVQSPSTSSEAGLRELASADQLLPSGNAAMAESSRDMASGDPFGELADPVSNIKDSEAPIWNAAANPGTAVVESIPSVSFSDEPPQLTTADNADPFALPARTQESIPPLAQPSESPVESQPEMLIAMVEPQRDQVKEDPFFSGLDRTPKDSTKPDPQASAIDFDSAAPSLGTLDQPISPAPSPAPSQLQPAPQSHAQSQPPVVQEDLFPQRSPEPSPATGPPVSEPLFGGTATTVDANPFGENALRPVEEDRIQSLRPAPRQRIYPAVATAADGKFSLAAFNYQNGAQPPVDDGQKYDIVEVQDGDNYTKISKRVYGTSRYFSALAVFNQHRIGDPKKMRPGMKVLTPPKSVLEDRYPQLFVDASSRTVEPAGFLILEDGSPAYRVGERETLSEISQRFLGRSARWIEIFQLNQSLLADPNRLKAGTVLALPADAVEVNIAP